MDSGLPSPMLSKDQIMDLETYVKKIDIHAQNTTACSISLPETTLPNETLRKIKRTIIAEDQWWNDLLEIL